ncbi:MAG: hypothetical protein K9N51_00930 [Candidatus Pacebacteria bacterium]|nr:hypothetical protein [Candidatus Paceibacterota bacterium]
MIIGQQFTVHRRRFCSVGAGHAACVYADSFRSAVLASILLLSCVGLVGCRTGFKPGFPETLESAVSAMPMPRAGEHPRVLFTRDALPAIRARAETPGGQKALQRIAWQADHPGKPVLQNAREGQPEKAEHLVQHAFNQAFVYLITQDQARLEKALTLLDAWSVQYQEKKAFGGGGRNGYRFALAYDWLYDDLAPATRDAMRDAMAAGMTEKTLHNWNHLGYYKGAHNAGRPCDWGAIESGSRLLHWLAIAGEDPRASREFLRATVNFMQYIADYTLTADGYMNAGNGYAAGDFQNYGYAVRALQVHGVPLVDHPNLQAFAEWLAYESIPGQYVFDTRNFSNGYHQGLSPLVVTLAQRHGAPAAWLADQARGPDRSDSIGVPGVLWGEFSDDPVPPPNLPLARRFSTMGLSISRSGWNAGSYFCLHMEPIHPSKSHADKGTFTFYSHGQNFAADSENGFPNSEDHNVVLIDGKGQYNSGGRTVLDAIPRGFLASDLVDFNHLDIKPAYERYLAYTKTRPGRVDWTKLEYGLGLPFRWEVYRPMHHADRYGLYIRGSVQPYVVILDDIQQDDEEHEYQWLMHSRTGSREIVGPGHARVSSRYGGEYVQAEKRTRLTFSANAPAANDYSVYVLLRKWPQLKSWFSHHIGISVNGETTHFRLGDHLDDWQWTKAGVHELKTGVNTVTVHASRGLRVAQVVAVPGEGTPPERMLGGQAPGNVSEGMIVFERQADLNPEEWSVRRDPHARMDVYFLQPGAEDVTLDFWKKARRVPVALRAEQRAVRAGFAALLIPYDDRDPTPVLTHAGNGGAILQWGPYTDYLCADPTASGVDAPGAAIQSDGRFALVRTRNKELVGYTLIAGTTLSFRGETLVQNGTAPVHVVHDGSRCVAQTPKTGATFQVRRLTAGTVVLNRREQAVSTQSAMIALRAKPLPQKWDVDVSPDGRTVTVTGNGPLPLKVHAPRAVRCMVNGASVWFSRDGFGNIYPKIELTELTHGTEPLNSKPSDAVPQFIKTGE